MNIQYKKLEETSFTLNDVLDLLHEVFADRVAEGMNFMPAKMTMEDFRKDSLGSVIFVAFDNDTNTLLGTGSLKINKKKGKLFGQLNNLAVSRKARRMGVASNLYIYIERESIACNCSYISSNTAVGATSSVNYHLKNGFQIVGLGSWAITNYYSYIFRKQLKHPSLWDYSWYCKFRYCLSSFFTRLCYTELGQETTIGKLYSAMILPLYHTKKVLLRIITRGK